MVQKLHPNVKDYLGLVAAQRNATLKREPMDAGGISRAIDYFLALTGASVVVRMRSIGLKPKSTQASRRGQLEAAIRSGELKPDVLTQWIEQTEGWGHHQVQFLDANPTVRKPWRSGELAESLIEKLNLWHLVDAPRPLWPTDEPQLYSIHRIGTRLRVVWAEVREYLERNETKDQAEEDTIWKAYDRSVKRCFHYFDMDAATGQAQLILRKLPTGQRYKLLIDRLLDDLDPLVPRAGLSVVPLRTAIESLNQSGTASRRRMNLQTPDRASIQVVSADKARDAFDNKLMQTIGADLLSGSSATHGLFYWTCNASGLQRLIGTRIMPLSDRFTIEGQCEEGEVIDVLRRVRAVS